ncbi:MAG: M48 family metalloprotease [Micrococcales bacterium]|nr:M48 family metalloprotease [Micrococcales bacterium]
MGDTSASPVAGTELLAALPYHRRLVDLLRQREPALWRWFASDEAESERAERLRLELLRSTYRLTRESHPELYAAADRVAFRLGVTEPLALYQAQNGGQPSAALVHLPGEAHLVLIGGLLGLLSEAELAAVIGHELTHLLLWRQEDRQFMVADRILEACAADERCEPSLLESCRQYRLATEALADRGAVVACADAGVAIAALLKVTTGLTVVDPAGYLAQAEEVLRRGGEPGSAEDSHPETFLRARALARWARAHASELAALRPEGAGSGPWQEPLPDGSGAEGEIAAMLAGPPSLAHIDLQGQVELTSLTEELLKALLEPAFLRTEAVLGHARMFFAFEELAAPAEGAVAALAALVDRGDGSLRDYVCYLLLDVVAADPDLEEVALAGAGEMAERLGVLERFAALAVVELGLRKKAVTDVLARRAELLEAAARQLEAGS